LPKTSISSFAAAAAGAFEKRAGEETGPEMRSQFSSSSAGPLLFPPIYPLIIISFEIEIYPIGSKWQLRWFTLYQVGNDSSVSFSL
jgi:hypothetical protein